MILAALRGCAYLGLAGRGPRDIDVQEIDPGRKPAAESKRGEPANHGGGDRPVLLAVWLAERLAEHRVTFRTDADCQGRNSEARRFRRASDRPADQISGAEVFAIVNSADAKRGATRGNLEYRVCHGLGRGTVDPNSMYWFPHPEAAVTFR